MIRAAAFALVVALLTGCGGSTTSAPVLSVDRLTHEFPPGDDWKPVTEFVVTNTGGAVLKIDNIEASCGCTTANAGKSELAAGEKTTLRIRVDRPAIGYQKATVTIQSNSRPDAAASLELTCWARSNEPRIVDVRPRRVVVRNYDGGDAPEITITAYERADERLIRDPECDLPFVALAESGKEASSLTAPEYISRKYVFVAALTDQHPFGRFEGRITFPLHRRPADTGPREIVVPIEVVAVPPVYADPNVLFGSTSGTNPAPEWRVNLRRRSSGVTAMPIEAKSNADWLAVELQAHDSALPASGEGAAEIAGTLLVRVTSAPAPGSARAEVTVRSDDRQLPEIVIPVVVTHDADSRDDANGQ